MVHHQSLSKAIISFTNIFKLMKNKKIEYNVKEKDYHI